jgi:single-stranded-DNA-specific exonuclease
MFDWDVQYKPSSFEELSENLLSSRIGNLTRDQYFNPPQPVTFISETYFDPFLIENLKKAKEIIFDAIKNNELIIIHGDYDADGVCATSIILKTIKETLNYQLCEYIIPDRFEDGYGLSDKTLQKILDLSFNQRHLLITVDCGITSVSQINELKKRGNRVILTDHHHKPELLPEADAIVWSDKVVGTTLSWILSLGLGNKDPKYLSLASIATITDVFPLIDINRSIVKHGIKVLQTNPPLSIKSLSSYLGKSFKDIGTYELGFVIGPRLNSSGRIGSADSSIEFMISEDEDLIKDLISKIDSINQKRQQITEESLESLSVDENNLPKIVVVYNPNFHEGVMGLIASKIVQKYHRPALVISNNHDKLKGSARSIKGINVIDILNCYKDMFLSVGGHELAAGFSLSEDKLPILKEKLASHMEEFYSEFSFVKKIKIDADIEFSLVDMGLLNFIKSMEPFGPANEEPCFSTKGCIIKDKKFIGEKKNHLSLILDNSGKSFKALLFNYDKVFENLYLGQKIDIVYKIRKNEYNNNVSIDLNLVDIKLNND